MANPTTYFGWVMPTATDLVTDLPADFNVFGQGVDTSMQDLLGGTTGQVLAKASATNMDFTWTTPSGGMSWSQVLARTTMGTGTSYTASSLSGYNQLMFLIDGLNNNGTTGKYTVNFNSDTGSNYLYFGGGYTTGMPTTVGTGTAYGTTTAQTSIDLADVPAGSTLDVGAGIHIMGSNTAGIKTGYLQSGMEQTTNTTASKYTRHLHFRYNGTSVISSITITATAGNFDGGFMTILGSVN